MRTDATLSQRVAEEIRALMARRRISGRQLAEHLGVSQSWISYRMTGTQEIGLNDLARIADALGVGVLDLLPVDEDRTRRTAPLEPRLVVTADRGRSAGIKRRYHPRSVRTGPRDQRATPCLTSSDDAHPIRPVEGGADLTRMIDAVPMPTAQTGPASSVRRPGERRPVRLRP